MDKKVSVHTIRNTISEKEEMVRLKEIHVVDLVLIIDYKLKENMGKIKVLEDIF